jgi:hypothetical protein
MALNESTATQSRIEGVTRSTKVRHFKSSNWHISSTGTPLSSALRQNLLQFHPSSSAIMFSSGGSTAKKSLNQDEPDLPNEHNRNTEAVIEQPVQFDDRVIHKFYEERVVDKSVIPLLKVRSVYSKTPKETFTIGEIEQIIRDDRELRLELAKERKRHIYVSIIIGFIVLAGLLVGCAVAGYRLAADSSVDDDNVMTSKSSGQAVQTANVDMMVNGSLLSNRNNGGDLLTGQLTYSVDASGSENMISMVSRFSSVSPCGSVDCNIDELLSQGYTFSATQPCDASNDQLAMMEDHGFNSAMIRFSNMDSRSIRGFETDGYQAFAEYTLIDTLPVKPSYVDERYLVFLPAAAVGVVPYQDCISPILAYPIRNITYLNSTVSSVTSSGRKLTADVFPLVNHYTFDINTLEEGGLIDRHLAQRIMREPVRSGNNIPLPLVVNSGLKVTAGIEVSNHFSDGMGAHLKYHFHVPVLDLRSLTGTMQCDQDPREMGASCRLFLNDYVAEIFIRKLAERRTPTYMNVRYYERVEFEKSYSSTEECLSKCPTTVDLRTEGADDDARSGKDYNYDRLFFCSNKSSHPDVTMLYPGQVPIQFPKFIPRDNYCLAINKSQITPGRHCLACNNLYNHECFAGDSQVELRGGVLQNIADVMVGDQVRVYDASSKSFFYSEVIAFPHIKNSIRSVFLHIETAKRSMTGVTSNHLVLARACHGDVLSYSLQTVRSLSLGSCLLSEDGEEKILKITPYESQGVYTIVTMAGLPVVDGFVVSPFETSHVLPNAFYNIHRLVFTVMPRSVLHWYQPLLKMLTASADNMVNSLPLWMTRKLVEL